MKKFIYVAAVFVLLLIFNGCATTPEERKETYDLRKSVGNQPFVGDRGGLDARGLLIPPITY